MPRGNSRKNKRRLIEENRALKRLVEILSKALGKVIGDVDEIMDIWKEEEHLETILEVVSHLWNIIPEDKRKELDHYRKAIGEANYYINEKNREVEKTDDE